MSANDLVVVVVEFNVSIFSCVPAVAAMYFFRIQSGVPLQYSISIFNQQIESLHVIESIDSSFINAVTS